MVAGLRWFVKFPAGGLQQLRGKSSTFASGKYLLNEALSIGGYH